MTPTAWLLLCLAALMAVAIPRAALAADRARLPIHQSTLDNGLRVVIQPDRAAATAVVAVSYLAGEADEPPDRRGVARLVERMMFAGGGDVQDGGHEKLLEEAGGSARVLRGAEVVTYADRLPVERIELALWLEAQRMSSLRLGAASLERERKRLLRERDAREYRDMQAIALARLRATVLAGQGALGRKPEAALERIGRDEVERFYREHHGPGRAALVIVGPVDPEATVALARRYFGGIRRHTSAPRPPASLAAQTSRRAASLRSPGAQRNALAYGWPIAGAGSAEHAALEIAAAILAGGGSWSRLHDDLVGDKTHAFAVDAGTDGLRGPDVLHLLVELPRGRTPSEVIPVVEAHVQRLGSSGPTADELAAAKAVLARRALSELEDEALRAHRLAEHALLHESAEELRASLDRFDEVEREDVRSAVARHLLTHRGTIVECFAGPLRRAPASAEPSSDKKKRRKKTRTRKRKRPKRATSKKKGRSKKKKGGKTSSKKRGGKK